LTRLHPLRPLQGVPGELRRLAQSVGVDLGDHLLCHPHSGEGTLCAAGPIVEPPDSETARYSLAERLLHRGHGPSQTRRWLRDPGPGLSV
jgi:hypothetical protein